MKSTTNGNQRSKGKGQEPETTRSRNAGRVYPLDGDGGCSVDLDDSEFLTVAGSHHAASQRKKLEQELTTTRSQSMADLDPHAICLSVSPAKGAASRDLLVDDVQAAFKADKVIFERGGLVTFCYNDITYEDISNLWDCIDELDWQAENF